MHSYPRASFGRTAVPNMAGLEKTSASLVRRFIPSHGSTGRNDAQDRNRAVVGARSRRGTRVLDKENRYGGTHRRELARAWQLSLVDRRAAATARRLDCSHGDS